MTRTELDRLVEALETAVSAAQSSTDRRQQSALRFRCEQQDGRTSAIDYALYVPSGRGVDGRAEMIEIPLCSLRANSLYQVSRVSLEFATRYQASDDRQDAALETPKRSRLQRVLNWLQAWPKRGWPRRARVEMQCTGTDPLTSELRIDGEVQNGRRPVEARLDSSRAP